MNILILARMWMRYYVLLVLSKSANFLYWRVVDPLNHVYYRLMEVQERDRASLYGWPDLDFTSFLDDEDQVGEGEPVYVLSDEDVPF